MLSHKKKHKKTVSEKVAELILNPNDGDKSKESSDDEATAPRVEEFDEDDYDLPIGAQSTEFRKRNIKLLSEQSARYKGKIAKRKDFEEEEDEDGEEEEKEAALQAFRRRVQKLCSSKEAKQLSKKKSESDEDFDDMETHSEDDDEDDEAEEEDGDDEGDDDDVEDNDEDESASSVQSNVESNESAVGILCEKNRQAEIQKGVCVKNQLFMWERLLEFRIHLQKLLNKANQLPTFKVLQVQESDDDETLQRSITECKASTHGLLKSLLMLQQSLCYQFSEVKGVMANSSGLKRKIPYNSDTVEPPLKRISEHLTQHFDEFKSYRNAVLLKWDDRTKLLTPGAGVKKKSLQEEYDIVKKIEGALINRSALVEKSQMLKTNTDATVDKQKAATTSADDDAKANVSRNPNIYDDSDFYHQQLRELIEYKTNTSGSLSEVTRQYVELQKLRQKMKKKVDTRASKGRKIRYTVHNKLVNFMAPIENASSWTDESKDELYKSLFAAT